MLAALVHKKDKGMFNQSGDFLPKEDLVTATIFEPLKYFAAQQVYDWINTLLNHTYPSQAIMSFNMDFWPSGYLNQYGSSIRVEPDIVFDFYDAQNQQWRVIFENKWHSDYFENQLENEWDAFKTEQCRLVYLSHVIKADFYAKPYQYQKNFRALTWIDVLNHAKHAHIQSPMFREYLNSIHLALTRLGVSSFNGFMQHSIIPTLHLAHLQSLTQDKNYFTINTLQQPFYLNNTWKFNYD